MPKFIIERDINDAGSLTTDELQGISQKSCSVLKKLGTETKVMNLLNNYVESWIRESPEQWIWIHNRW